MSHCYCNSEKLTVPKFFYFFPNIVDLTAKSERLSGYLPGEASVTVLAGTSFGRYGEGYLRLSYANR